MFIQVVFLRSAQALLLAVSLFAGGFMSAAQAAPAGSSNIISSQNDIDRTPGAAASASSPGNSSTGWIGGETQRLVSVISAPQTTPAVAFFGILLAVFLGAMHAFSPGHGKTVVGAYLIGSRGTPRHAAFLGTTVTITHTLGVFVLGLATLFATRYFAPEVIFPILSLISGGLVLIVGLTLLMNRLRDYRAGSAGTTGHAHDHGHAHHDDGHHHQGHGDHSHDHHSLGHHHSHADGRHHALAPAHAHDHGTERNYAYALLPGSTHSTALVHSHGGSEHSHMPPGSDGEPVRWSSLLALGISGGLVPCPSALVLLLAAVSLHKIAYGLVLVLAFSVGLAITLTLAGLVFIYARRFVELPARHNRLIELLPVISAALVTCLGLIMCYAAVQGTI